MSDLIKTTPLSPTVVKQVERLGGRFLPKSVAAPAPAPANNPVILDGYSVPEPLRQFLFELEWPQNVTYANNSSDPANLWVWRFVPTHLAANRAEYLFLQQHPTAQIIGIADGGNYLLLTLLDCENPANPPVYRLDHDDNTGYAQGPVALSQFLTSLSVETTSTPTPATDQIPGGPASISTSKPEQRNTPKIQKHALALQAADSKVRYRSAKTLATLRDERVVPILLAALTDANPGVLIQAATGLGILGASSAIEPLAKLLHNTNANANNKVRLAVVEALARIGTTRAIEILIEAMGEHTSLQYPISSALGGISGVAALSRLFEILAGSQSQLHFYSALALTKIGEPAVAGFIKLLAHPDVSTRTCSVRALGELGDKRAVAPLIAVIADEPDTYLRYQIMIALGKLGDARALPLLEHLAQTDEGRLSGDDFEIKNAAAEALHKIKQSLLA